MIKFFQVCLIAGVVGLPSHVFAGDTYVNGYYRSDGTYVQPHYRSSPNNTKIDNWSQRGNTNPYTGRSGTQDCGLYCNNYGSNSRSSIFN